MSSIICLDIGEKRIGVAVANTTLKLATPHSTVPADGNEITEIAAIIEEYQADTIVVGLPRNLQGEETAQSKSVRELAKKIKRHTNLQIHFQDESLTTVEAKRRLEAWGKQYMKADVDKEAAAIILQDYLGVHPS